MTQPPAPRPPLRGPGANPLLVMTGCPRSGTTLLQRMLDAHGMIAMGPTLRWLATAYRDDVGITPDGLVTRRFLDEFEQRPRLFKPEQATAIRAEIEQRLADRPVPYGEFIVLICDRYGEQRGKPHVGTKTWQFVRDYEAARQHLPHMKVVHIIRDGRDTALSMLNWRRADKMGRFATWQHDPVATAALWWEWHVRLMREAGAIAGPDRYYELRYETLVTEPERECAALCRFLGVPYDGAMTRYHEGHTNDDPTLDVKHRWLPPTPGLRDWRSEMTGEEIMRFEALAGDLLAELGYPPASDPARVDRERAAWLRGLFVPDGRLPTAWQEQSARAASRVGD